MAKYVTTAVKFETLEKKLNRLFKKITTAGGTYTFTIGERFMREVPVYHVDEELHTKREVDKMTVECVEFELDFDHYQVGDYEVGAVVERVTDEDNAVFELATAEAADFAQYRHCELHCEHCKTNHKRKRTIVLIDRVTRAHKMVGTACVKDYTGYEVETFAKYFDDIQEILANLDDCVYDTDREHYPILVSTRKYLAECIRLILQNGYDKNVTKFEAFENCLKRFVEDEYFERADKVIEFFKALDTSYANIPTFWHDTKLYVTKYLCIKRANGFVAYAYVLMNKIIEEQKAKEAADAIKHISTHVGEIGQKIVITGKVDIVGGYQTQYGYTTIYKITDENNNVFIWKTNTGFTFADAQIDEIEEITVQATIKAHNEYDGQKQTIITRCKIQTYKVKQTA